MVSAPVKESEMTAEEVVAEPTDKVPTDPNVMNTMIAMLGRDVVINTFDGKRFRAVLTSISPDQGMGFEMVTELTDRNRLDLLRTECETEPKVFFEFDQIVDYVFPIQEDKAHEISSKFVTDRQYHGDIPNASEELEAWCGADDDEGVGGSIEDPDFVPDRRNHRNNQNGPGWSAENMFLANREKVKSDFREDLTQYTTVPVVGDEEDRARAERLAREIESNSSSRFYANLENDDVERDLDKTTNEDDFEYGNGHRRGNHNQSQNQRRNQNQNPNLTPNGQPINRRAEGLRSDRRNSGSSGNNSRFGPPQQNYQPPQQQQKGGGNYGNNRRQNDEYRENTDWQMAKGKGQQQNQGNDSSFRHQQKQMLDPRPTPKQSTNEGEKTQQSSSRVNDLKNWRNDFDMVTAPKEQSPAPGGAQTSSAWTRGPPSSLVAKESSPTPPTETEAEKPAAPTPAQAPVVAAPAAAEKKEESPSTSTEGTDSVDGKPKEENLNVSTESTTPKPASSFKFNINAAEFKPRGETKLEMIEPEQQYAPSEPATPTNMMPQNGGMYMNDYHQQAMMQQGGVPMGMPPPHLAQGGAQNHQYMMWQQQQQQQQHHHHHQQQQQGPPQGPPGGFQQNQHQQQYPMQQVGMPGVPGQMYGPAATAPATVQNNPNQQIPVSAAGGMQPDGRSYPQQRRDGEYKEQTVGMYPVSQNGPMVIPQSYFTQQYAPGPAGFQAMKMIPPQQAAHFQRYQQQQMYMGVQGPRYQGGPPNQMQYGGPDQGGPQSHPNSQPTTPGPRGEQNGPKPPPPNGGLHQQDGGSSASLSGSTSSQSGQRSGSPSNGAAPPPQQQQQQHQQGPPHGGPPPGQMMMAPHAGHPQYFVVPGHPNMHTPQAVPYPYPQQGVYFPVPVGVGQSMIPPHPHPQHPHMYVPDAGMMGDNLFDYRTLPLAQQQALQQQQQQQQQQQHMGHMPRQNSLPQQYPGQGVNQQHQHPNPNLQQNQQHQNAQNQGGNSSQASTPRLVDPQQAQ